MQITYKDKVTLQSNSNIPDENKVTAEDMNEIKSVVNSNEEEQQDLTLSVQEIAQNVVNNSQEISNIKEEQTTQNDNIQTNSNNISDLQSNKADKNEIPTDLSQLSNDNTKFVNETGLENAISQEKTQRQNADNNLQNQVDTNKTNIQTNATNIATNTQGINTIKAEQTTQNNRLNSLEVDNTTNKSDILTNKQEINNIKTEQTEQNTNISTNATNIETLQSENETLKSIVAQLPQVTGQGTEVTLENTIEAQFTKFDVEGNSEQETTEGRQLLKYPYVATTTIINGVTFTDNGDGSLKINGTASEEARFNLQWDNKVPAGSYTYIIFNLPNNCFANYYTIGNKYGEDVGNRTSDTEINLGSSIIVPAGVTVSNVTVYPMLVSGTYTRETIPNWEKYTGGIASPNPSYEQPIESAGDNGSINEKIQTRNWFDIKSISQLIKNGTITTDGITNIDNVITINKTNGQHGSYAMNYLMPIKSGKITVSFKALLSGTNSSTGILVALYNSTATIYATTAQTKYASSKDKWLDYSATFELNQEAIDGIHLDIQALNTGNVIQIKDVQVELGSTATPYVEHKEQDYSIFVQQPMRSIGDVRDGFVKVNGNWFERHYILRKIFDGTEEWGQNGSTASTGQYVIATTDKKYGILNLLSNSFVTKQTSTENSIAGRAINRNIYITIDLSIVEFSVAKFKAYLAEKYASGKSVYVDYELETPLDLPCTQSQIQQLENLPSTYKDFTIIQSEDETPAYLEVSGIRDINTMFDKVTNAIVSLGGNV